VLDDDGGDLVSLLTLSEEPLRPEHVSSTLMVRRLVRELADLLDCEPRLEAVQAARRSALGSDHDRYVTSLFRDAGIELLLCDVGHPVDREGRPTVAIDRFSTQVGTPCRVIFRVDTVFDRLVPEGMGFPEFMERCGVEVGGALDRGAVGLKSTIAYRSGLDVRPPEGSEVHRAYDAVVGGTGSDADRKVLHDHLFVWTLERAIERDVPLQIHTGMGDGPIFDLTTATPALLREILFDPRLRRARIVLTHAGYPWVRESAWLANQYDNVFIDISEMTPFAAHGVADGLRGLLELAPTTKLLFGSDGFNTPELHWFGTHTARRAIGHVLTALLHDGWIGHEGEAIEIASSILRGNAVSLYGLGSDRSSTGDPGTMARR
jgi:hypothetical protein